MKNAEQIAARLLEARAGGAPVDAASEPGPADLAEVYRVQDIVLRALSGAARAGAWKAIPPRPGAEPAAAPVPRQLVIASPGSFDAGPGMLGAEAEIAFRLGEDLAPVEALALIELAATRLASWDSAPVLWKLADFQSNGVLVVGSGTADWRAIDFRMQSVELQVNGRLVKDALGTHPSGDPAALLPWLVKHAAKRGGLLAGDIVTTGSWVGIVPVRAGDEVLARFPGIGEALLRL